MSTTEARARLHELRGAFDTLILANEGLTLVPPLLPPGGEAPESFVLRLVGAGSPEVHLRVATDAADLTASSGSDHPKAGRGAISDTLGVALDAGFAWDDSVCDSADELAGLLLKHMRRRLKTVAEVLPDR